MKNLVVANFRPGGRASEEELRRMVEAQVENSLTLGWAANDIYVVTNLAFSLPVVTVEVALYDQCLTGSKMFALEHLFTEGLMASDDLWWAHDLDAWQNFSFAPPPMLDIALAEYSFPRFNGGSVLLRASARDLVARITSLIKSTKSTREEPAINRVLRSPEHRPRVTTLNSTFNVGCSSYAVRYARSEQPILVSHFHPTKGSAWRTHVEGRNSLGKASVCERLRELLRRHFRPDQSG